MNIRRRNSGPPKLPHGETTQGEEKPSGASREELTDCAAKLIAQRFTYFYPHLITRHFNARTDQGAKAPRRNVRVSAETCDAGFNDAGQESPPAGMKGGNAGGAIIEEENRKAISRPNADGHAVREGNASVRPGKECRGRRSGNDGDAIAMNLIQPDQAAAGHTQPGGESILEFAGWKNGRGLPRGGPE